MACSPSNKRRVWCVFGVLVPMPSEVCQIDWRTVTAEPRQSTSDHRKPAQLTPAHAGQCGQRDDRRHLRGTR